MKHAIGITGQLPGSYPFATVNELDVYLSRDQQRVILDVSANTKTELSFGNSDCALPDAIFKIGQLCIEKTKFGA